jgi:hypothetical protein
MADPLDLNAIERHYNVTAGRLPFEIFYAMLAELLAARAELAETRKAYDEASADVQRWYTAARASRPGPDEVTVSREALALWLTHSSCPVNSYPPFERRRLILALDTVRAALADQP